MNNEYEQIYLFKIGLYHYLGKENNAHWRHFKKDWRARHGWPNNCSVCGGKVKVFKNSPNKSNTLTLDHIIPDSMLQLLEIPELMFDKDNFMLLCNVCNLKKGDTMPDLDTINPKLRHKFLYLLDERNKRLATTKF